MPPVLRIATDAAMRDLGRELAARLRAGDLVIVTGPLGAGKTTLVQGIGQGLGVPSGCVATGQAGRPGYPKNSRRAAQIVYSSAVL